MWVRDRLDGLWSDEDFVGWYPRDGRPGLSPAQLATVCVLQFLLDPLRNNDAGTPQGSILSPLLSNVALSVLDEYVAQGPGGPASTFNDRIIDQ